MKNTTCSVNTDNVAFARMAERIVQWEAFKDEFVDNVYNPMTKFAQWRRETFTFEIRIEGLDLRDSFRAVGEDIYGSCNVFRDAVRHFRLLMEDLHVKDESSAVIEENNIDIPDVYDIDDELADGFLLNRAKEFAELCSVVGKAVLATNDFSKWINVRFAFNGIETETKPLAYPTQMMELARDFAKTIRQGR